LITFFPFTVLVTQSFPRLPITCSLIILVKFKKVGGQITLFMIGGGQKVFPKLPTRQSNGIHPFISIQINTGRRQRLNGNDQRRPHPVNGSIREERYG
jgi:hypothetical protein